MVTKQPHLPAWSIPFGYCALAVLLGATLPRIEHSFFPAWEASITVAAITAMYSSVATGMLALTGIVFSLVFVMVQFTSVAYSPRLVTFLARDPLLFHAMGIFMATFLYSIAALAWVDRNGSGKAPFLSALVVIVLLLASMGMFVGLVHRLAGMHISNVLRFTGDFGRRTLDKLYPPLSDGDVQRATEDFRSLPAAQTLFYTGPPRTIQLLDVAALLALAEESDGIVEVTSAVGDTVVEGTLLLRIFTARRPISTNALLKAIRMGTRRTFEQDPKYAIRLLVDIAIRALSPAVNDPSTAVQALDHIEDLLVRLGRRRLEIGEIRDRAGRLKVVIPIPTWEDFLHLALDEIRFYGVESLQVMRRMRALLNDLKVAVCEVRRSAVRDQEKRLDATIARSFADRDDLLEASVEDREGLGMPRKRNMIRTGTNSGHSGQHGPAADFPLKF